MRGRIRTLTLVTMTLILGGSVAAASADPGPTLPLGNAGRFVTDASGRVVILHGLNEVYKVPPYYPSASGFGSDDAAFLGQNGFDAVRVGVLFEALEPQPGAISDGYLGHVAQTVGTLAQQGIVSLLDFHQDLFSGLFQGEGFPVWAVQDAGLPNISFGSPFLDDIGNVALQAAFDNFWANAPGPGGVGLQDRFAAAWAHVAKRFAGNPNVLGYELLNEPFPGTLWESCLSGCGSFDGQLTHFYSRVDAAIRTVDPRTLVWYEPNILFDFGAPTGLGSIGDPNAGFSFHDYCLTEPLLQSNSGCDGADDAVFGNALGYEARTGVPGLLTEFGATNDASNLEAMVDRADRNMTGWLEWAYSGVGDITTSGPGAIEALVENPAVPPLGANVNAAKLKILARPYPQVVAGTPTSYGFDAAKGEFALRYRTTRADGRGSFPAYAETDIAAPAIQYTNGYAIQIDGGALASPPGASVARILACPGAGAVSVTLTRGGASSESCAPPPGAAARRLPRLHVTVRPRAVAVGRVVSLRVHVERVRHGHMAPVRGARIRIGRHAARTGRHGIAVLRLRFHARGRRHLLVQATGFRRAQASVRVR